MARVDSDPGATEGHVAAGGLSRFELSPSHEEEAARLARPNPWGISALIELSGLAGSIRWPVLLFAAALVYILPVLPVERNPAALGFALGCVIVSARLASIRLEGHSPRVGIQSVCLVLAVGFGILGVVAGISVSVALAFRAMHLAAIANALLVMAVGVLGVLGSVWAISAWMWLQCQRHPSRRDDA